SCTRSAERRRCTWARSPTGSASARSSSRRAPASARASASWPRRWPSSSRTVRLESADLADVAALLDALEADARAPLALAGVAAADVTVRRFAEMRYRGQGYELEVPLPPGRPDAAW